MLCFGKSFQLGFYFVTFELYTICNMESRKRSHIWNSFSEVSPGQAKCGLCMSIISFKGGSTCNLSRHLKNRHVGVNYEKEKRPKTCTEQVFELPVSVTQLEKSSPATPSTFTMSSSPIAINTSQPSITKSVPGERTSQSSLTSYIHKPIPIHKSKAVDEQLVKLIVKDYHPFSIVESESFKSFVKTLNPGYSLPSRKTVSTSLIPQLYNKTAEVVREELNDASAVAITTDGWTSITNQSYFSLTAHFIDDQCNLKSYLLDCFEYEERHTAENIAGELQRVVNEWGISSKICGAITDNAANMTAAIRLCKWRHIPCFAHSINLIVQAGIQEICEVQKKVKSIVEFFKRSPQATAKLLVSQKQMELPEHKLIQDIVTRWNSTYDMFERFIELKEAIISTLSLLNSQIPQLTSDDWDVLVKACEILRVFKEVSTEMSSEKSVTISKVILLRYAMLRHVSKISRQNLPDKIKDMVEKLQEQLNKRLPPDTQDNIVLSEATLLDPRFKKQGFQNENAFNSAYQRVAARAGECCISQLEESSTTQDITDVKTPSSSVLWEDFDAKVENLMQNKIPRAAGIIELDRYLQEPLIRRHENPLQWWKHKKHTYPRLFEVMKKRLCVVATSVPSERVFSKSGHLISERRNRIKPKNVSKVIFLNFNLK